MDVLCPLGYFQVIMSDHIQKGGVDLPITLKGLFDESDSSCGEEENGCKSEEEEENVQMMELGGFVLQIEQSSFHPFNANGVWPAAFILANYIKAHDNSLRKSNESSTKVLEIGSATGALAIALSKMGFEVTTSDYADDEIEGRIARNFERNGLEIPLHIPHTWGSGWWVPSSEESSEEQSSEQKDIDNSPPSIVDFVVASDILIYVKSYPQLVQTFVEIFRGPQESLTSSNNSFMSSWHPPSCLLMGWKRKIADASLFFDMMKDQGFSIIERERGIYQCYFRQHPPENETNNEENITSTFNFDGI